jgi:hypothetical protein
LRRRIRHLEHDLRDITARCHAERERRMSLEALIGGKITISCLTPALNIISLDNCSLSQTSLIGTAT